MNCFGSPYKRVLCLETKQGDLLGYKASLEIPTTPVGRRKKTTEKVSPITKLNNSVWSKTAADQYAQLQGEVATIQGPSGALRLNYAGTSYVHADRAWRAVIFTAESMKDEVDMAALDAHLNIIFQATDHPIGGAIGQFIIQNQEHFRRGPVEALASKIHKYIMDLDNILCDVFGFKPDESHYATRLPLENGIFGPIYAPLRALCRNSCIEADEVYCECVAAAGGATMQGMPLGEELSAQMHAALYPAVQRMQELPTEHSPYAKTCVIRDSCNLITSSIQQLDVGKHTGADDLLPLLVSVLIQADIPNFPSEMKFVEQLLMEDQRDGEMGYFLACGNAALGRILALTKASPTTTRVANAT